MFNTANLSNSQLSVLTNLPPQLHSILEDIRSNIGSDIVQSDPVKEYKGITSSNNHTSYELYKRYYRNISPLHKSCTARRKYTQQFRIKNTPYIIKLVKELVNHFNHHYIQPSNEIIYPSDKGFMGWHTNWGSPAIRMYLNYVDESDKSFFRYINPYTQEMVTSYDKKGWTARLFNITRTPPFWHCVYAETTRISIGFRIKEMK
jgi:hypothetical protein